MSDTDKVVQLTNNHLYLYGDISFETALAFNKLLSEANRSVADYGGHKIWMHISTYGGEASGMFAITDAILTSPLPVYTVIEGVAASAGATIALAGKKRYITAHSSICIHEPYTSGWGTYSNFKDDTRGLKQLVACMVNFYSQRTKLTKKQVRKYLKHDWWITAKQAKTMGFVHKILGE